MDGYWICIFPTKKHDSILMVYIQTTFATLLHLVGDGIYWERSKVGFGPPPQLTTIHDYKQHNCYRKTLSWPLSHRQTVVMD